MSPSLPPSFFPSFLYSFPLIPSLPTSFFLQPSNIYIYVMLHITCILIYNTYIVESYEEFFL